MPSRKGGLEFSSLRAHDRRYGLASRVVIIVVILVVMSGREVEAAYPTEHKAPFLSIRVIRTSSRLLRAGVG